MHVPEVNGAHQRDVEHAVVGHGVGQLLDTAAVVLAHTERDTEQQVVVDPFAVDPYLRARGFVAEEGADDRPRVEPAAATPLLFEVVEAPHDLRFVACARHVDHVAALAVFRLLVRYDAHVLQERMLLADGANGVGTVLRNTEHADPVVARPDGDHRQQHLRRRQPPAG